MFHKNSALNLEHTQNLNFPRVLYLIPNKVKKKHRKKHSSKIGVVYEIKEL